jgi:hypothetical protein
MKLSETMLATEIVEEETKVSVCKFARVFVGLDEDDQRTVREWVERGIGARRISLGFRQVGLVVGKDSITWHLSGVCSCDEKTDLKGVRDALA